MPQPLKPFLEVSEGPLDRRRVFAVRSDVVESQVSGQRHSVDRLLAADWVNVVAITAKDEIVLVRQWRFGARRFTLELPAGLVEPGEDPLAAGLRELREETGYVPGAPARVLGTMLPNPAFMNNTCTTVLAPACAQLHAQELDPMEEIEIVTVPANDVDALVRAGDLSTALGLAALTLWRL
jgi:ADP-ribose pyrophosphatase